MPDCHLCPKSYQSQNDLNRHLKKIHGINSPETINAIAKRPGRIG